MFHDLDAALKALLDDPGAPPALRDADVEFLPPERGYAPSRATVNLFLYDVEENRELRNPEPLRVPRPGGGYERRRPPLRLDCSYRVTAWAGTSAGAAAGVAEEHALLGLALAWLGRFPALPEAALAGVLPGQPWPPPLAVAQPNGVGEAGEFWSALGIPPRPAFDLVATIAVPFDVAVLETPVTTMVIRHRPGAAADGEEWIVIGGVLRDPTDRPVAGAWVALEPTGGTAATDDEGRFVFPRVRRGFGYRLRARAVGLGEVERLVDVPTPSGHYDLTFQ
jgi:hypothetical protein